MVERLILGSILTLVATISTAAVSAVEARTTNERSVAENTANQKKKTPERPVGKTDSGEERAATQLVQSHLPDLKPVLDHLRSDDPRQYNLAIRDLAKSARRLETSKTRDQELYDIELELLQARSSVQLLTAKLKVRDNQSDRKSLRAAASRLQQAELSRAKYDVRVLQERFDRMQKSLDAATQRLAMKETNVEEQLETSYLGLLRKAGRQADGVTAREKK